MLISQLDCWTSVNHIRMYDSSTFRFTTKAFVGTYNRDLLYCKTEADLFNFCLNFCHLSAIPVIMIEWYDSTIDICSKGDQINPIRSRGVFKDPTKDFCL